MVQGAHPSMVQGCSQLCYRDAPKYGTGAHPSMVQGRTQSVKGANLWPRHTRCICPSCNFASAGIRCKVSVRSTMLQLAEISKNKERIGTRNNIQQIYILKITTATVQTKKKIIICDVASHYNEMYKNVIVSF